MKYITLIALVLFCLALNAEPFHILVFVPNTFGANSMLNLEMYERNGWQVTLAGVTQTVTPCSADLPTLQMDELIQNIPDIEPYDAIVIWPCRWWQGNPYGDLIASPQALALIRQADQADKVIWSTCAGLRVLAAADIIEGVRVQGRPGTNNVFAAEYQAAGAIYLGYNLPPIIDSNIVTTTRGQLLWEMNNDAIGNALVGLQDRRNR